MRTTSAAIALFAGIAAEWAGCAGYEGKSLRERVFNLIAADGGVTRREGVPYGPLPRQKLDIYEPARTPEKAGVALFFYGGGWREGQRATYRFVGAALAARGFVTVIADYRLFPEAAFPEFMEDAARAYGWVDDHVARNGKRPIVLIGHSAGAYMAALLALDPSYLARFAPCAADPGGLVGMAGPYSFDPTTWPTTREVFSRAANDPDKARPVAFASSTAPPALLLYGLRDDVVGAENRLKLAKALTEQGASVQRIDYPGIGHIGLVMAIGRPLRWRAPVLDDIVDFLGSVSARAPKAAPGQNCRES
jgi:acetyl esterase/lipase